MGKLEVEGWPTIYKYNYFKKWDIIRCTYNSHWGVVVNEHPNSTYPGDIAVVDLDNEYDNSHSYYECPDNYELIWREDGV